MLYIDPSGHIKVCQGDDLGKGLWASGGEAVRELLSTPGALWELSKAIYNKELSLNDLILALGSTGTDIAGTVDYILRHSDSVWFGNPSDKEVYEYGRNLGHLLQTVAGSGSGAATKVISKTAPKTANILSKTEGAGKGFDNFNALKKNLGPAGEGKAWHHVVEQSQIQKSGFSPQQIHNTNNVIAVDSATHAKISGYYNSIDASLSDTMRVRDWLAGQSFETQYQFGMDVLKRFGVTK
ncbi:MAG: hypothetical protein AB1815_07925 [Bacillota bacterium]